MGACAGSHQRSKLTNVPQGRVDRNFRQGLRVPQAWAASAARPNRPPRASQQEKARRSGPSSSGKGAGAESASAATLVRDYGKDEARSTRVQAPCGTATGRGGEVLTQARQPFLQIRRLDHREGDPVFTMDGDDIKLPGFSSVTIRSEAGDDTAKLARRVADDRRKN